MGAMIVIRHPVADFNFWKAAFDSDPIGRAQNGVLGYAVYRGADDPNSVTVQLEFATLEEAQKFLPLLENLWRSVGDRIGFGAAAQVDAQILEEVERVRY